jgi:hypothetical protein
MLKFLHLGAALAAILSTQVISSVASQSKKTTNEWEQASTHQLVLTQVTPDFNHDTPEVAEKIDSTTILGLAALGGGAVAVALSAKKAKQSGELSSIPSRSNFTSKLDEESTIRIEQASRKLQKKLLLLLHDERALANRLLNQVKSKNPNKSVDWYVEKVIYDLERDRGGY